MFYRDFLEQCDTENLQDFRHRPFAVESFADDCQEHINGDGNPDLCLHGVLVVAVEAFDSEVLFDPFEEEFDTPACAVELCDGECGEFEIVGEEYEFALVFDVVERDPSERFGIEFGRTWSRQLHGLIAAKSGGLLDGSAIRTGDSEIRFGSRDEERVRDLKSVESFEIEVAAVHHVKGSSLQRKMIEGIHIVYISLGNVDKTGDAPTKVDERVKFDGSLSSTKLGPRKKREAEVDGGGVEGVDGVLERDAERFVGVKRACLIDEDVGEVAIDSPVVNAVGIGERTARDVASEARVISFSTQCVQTGFDVAEAFAEGELGEGEREKLIAAGESAMTLMATVTSNARVEFMTRQIVHQLGKNELAV